MNTIINNIHGLNNINNMIIILSLYNIYFQEFIIIK